MVLVHAPKGPRVLSARASFGVCHGRPENDFLRLMHPQKEASLG